MKRAELLQAGGYLGLPFAIAKRTDLNWTAKGVWACLANHLGPSNTTAWPSLTLIAREIGCGRRTVQTAIDKLTAAGLVKAMPPQPGETMTLPDGSVVPATTRYQLFQPEATLFDAAGDPPDDVHTSDGGDAPSAGAETAPSCGRIGASAESALAQNRREPSAETAHKVLKGSTEITTTPLPPIGGGGAATEADGPDEAYLEAEALLSSVGVVAYGRPREVQALKTDLDDPAVGLAGIRRAVEWCRRHGKRPNSYAYLAKVARSDRPPKTGKPDASREYRGGKNGF